MTTPPRPVSAATFPGALSALLRTGPARPLVTFHDDATGERVELSVATYANWVAKTAGLLQDELGLDRGAVVLVDLPTHWLGPVWLRAGRGAGAWGRGALPPPGGGGVGAGGGWGRGAGVPRGGDRGRGALLGGGGPH